MAKKSALGDTLDSLFDDFDGFDGDSESGAITLRIGDIEPNRNQPRKEFDAEKLSQLAESIRQHGLIQPITVRPHPSGIGYQIVAGERRWRASRIAELEEVPVRVMDLSDEQTMQIALIENLQREDLNPVEEAKGYRELMDNYGMTQERLSEIIGKARSTVTNSLRLLALPEPVLELVQHGHISKGHCKAIMSAGNAAEMIRLAKMAADGEISVRECEKLAKQSREPAADKRKAVTFANPFFRESALALGSYLNTKVKIVEKGEKKTLCIDFADEEDLKIILSGFTNESTQQSAN